MSDYTGPMEARIAYMRVHAQPEDVVKITNSTNPISFYLNLRVTPDSSMDRFPGSRSYPEWTRSCSRCNCC